MLYIDVSSLARWSGPPNGMIRTEREIANLVLQEPERAILVVYDRAAAAFRSIDPRWGPVMLAASARIDPWRFEHFDERSGWKRQVPNRQNLVQALERLRIGTKRAKVAAGADRLQRLLLGLRRHHFGGIDAEGRRVDLIPADMALGAAIAPNPGDTILIPASDWERKDLRLLAELKARRGVRIASLCYDLIPITHESFFERNVARSFARYWQAMLALSAVVIVNAKAVEADVADYCRTQGILPPACAVVALGHPERRVASVETRDLPGGLEAGRFALFVSTIEPRKNHAMLLRVWRRLREEPGFAEHGFRMVFVGRAGWMVEDVLAELQRERSRPDGVVHLADLGDEDLGRLYASAAFCLYPSHYEGYGLPVIEAFAQGRAVIASNGGSLAEVAGAVVPTLAPTDEDGWREAIGRWIREPEARRRCEEQIRETYPARRWSTAAREIIDAAEQA